MNRMTGIILMIIGILIFIVGIILFSSSKKNNEQKESDNELEKAIEMAIADGVLTNNERTIIKNITDKKGLEYNKVIKEIEAKIDNMKDDSETELIDQAKKKGYDFEKFIVQKFNKKYFKILEWAGDKYISGVYAKTTPQPDILLGIQINNQIAKFSVECKWRQKLYNGGVQFATMKQLNNYKEFAKKRKIPVFIAFGIGGKAISPKNIYIVPLNEIDNNFIPIQKLRKFEKTVDSHFFFDFETKELK